MVRLCWPRRETVEPVGDGLIRPDPMSPDPMSSGSIRCAPIRYGPMLSALLVCAVAMGILGCGGSAGAPAAPVISVSISAPVVIVSQDGTETVTPISIASPSETATVVLTGLPGGILQGYQPSDTNPSGVLTFVGGSNTPVGTYMPTITVHSAGAVATTQFTLQVTKAAK
jgi:hypothetical protein